MRKLRHWLGGHQWAELDVESEAPARQWALQPQLDPAGLFSSWHGIGRPAGAVLLSRCSLALARCRTSWSLCWRCCTDRWSSTGTSPSTWRRLLSSRGCCRRTSSTSGQRSPESPLCVEGVEGGRHSPAPTPHSQDRLGRGLVRGLLLLSHKL